MNVEHSVIIDCPPQVVFSVYKDVGSWPEWDPDIEAVHLEGEFAAGSKGWLKPVGAPKTATTMLQVVDNQSFIVESSLPLCKMRFEHELEPIGDKTKATHRVIFTGIAAPVFSRLVSGKINKTIDSTMQSLKNFSETLQAQSAKS